MSHFWESDPGAASRSAKPDGWPEIYGAAQNSMILKARANGLEIHRAPWQEESGEVSLREQPCLVLFPGEGVKVLIPMAESGATRENDLKNLLGTEVPYKVLRIDREAGLVIGSRKDALQHLKGITLRQIREGIRWKAMVRWVGKNYALLDLGGITSVLKPKDFSYGFVEDMREHLKIGERIDVAVLKVDLAAERVKVSVKELSDNPWTRVPKRYQAGGVYLARITGQADYGYFVAFEPGVYGVAKLPRFGRFAVGDQVMVRIREIDPERERIKGNIQG